eukprot:192642-Amphidinium_carterae.1
MPAVGWPCSVHMPGESACEDKPRHGHWFDMMCHHVMPCSLENMLLMCTTSARLFSSDPTRHPSTLILHPLDLRR